jgi:deoxyribose-phosphate aldolase
MDTTARIALRALAALDLTSLNEGDTPEDIAALCARARTPYGAAAAVCVYPEHVSTARRVLMGAGAPVRVATVVNFPDGSADPARAERETRRAIAAGADEIDVVFPWRALIAGDAAVGARVVSDCKAALPAGASLKVILETGELKDAGLIRRASDIALAHGADFLKTSTGKVPVNATPEVARVMLQAILDAKSGCGLKVAGRRPARGRCGRLFRSGRRDDGRRLGHSGPVPHRRQRSARRCARRVVRHHGRTRFGVLTWPTRRNR